MFLVLLGFYNVLMHLFVKVLSPPLPSSPLPPPLRICPVSAIFFFGRRSAIVQMCGFFFCPNWPRSAPAVIPVSMQAPPPLWYDIESPHTSLGAYYWQTAREARRMTETSDSKSIHHHALYFLLVHFVYFLYSN